ncbi:DNA ligase/mRNA capping enzyme [Suillus clintonianus]|uniref:DNA ligase/mRNA capping enzyme n=1 Tax=Suillus clintonianus TaxID=1904413 RepID=UPI001B882272|nr:DNA ligase/mRNA capping enzyme [Suillus clintonianus]KAG2122138.1 DNA ligase/mRNA capping enzyme [Suillus clintonianus]
MANAQAKQIPFSFLVSLLHEIANLPAHNTSLRVNKQSSVNRSPAHILRLWVEALKKNYSPLPRDTTTHVLRLLFPEEDSHRKYDLQEARLSQLLPECLDTSTFPPISTTRLKQWSKQQNSGCLGQEILALQSSDAEPSIGPNSLQGINVLLDELASTSAFSDKTLHVAHSLSPQRSKHAILRSLFESLPALDAAYLTQIILKDLRPILYAPPVASTSRALLEYNTNSKSVLTKEQFMKIWDPSGSMLKMYRARANMTEAALCFEAGGAILHPRPRWGVPVEIPKSAKGRSPLHALNVLRLSNAIWAETKYDGERAQIHVRFSGQGDPQITIFSKSKRDSTMDRIAVHPIIMEALAGYSMGDIILDAEMVAYSDERHRIEEFWHIRSLIARTAEGARAGGYRRGEIKHDSYTQDSCPSLHSNASSTASTLHLALVFFDVLQVGAASMLNAPYYMRRSLLESIITPVPGRSMLAERAVIVDGQEQEPEGQKRLREIWAKRITECEEGLVLKASDSTYGDWKLPWVKLKKDYVPGYGDTIDLVVVAAAWEKDRARELRLSPSTLTTFYIAVLSNSEQMNIDPGCKPHFVAYFTASYGLTREQLEEFNFWIRADAVDGPKPPIDELCYTYAMLQTLPRPSVFVRKPILVELCGAGFTKALQSKYYELRFPRITKTFRPSERSYMECITLRGLQTIAFEAVGREAHDAAKYKDLDDWGKGLWGKLGNDTAEKQRRELKRQRSIVYWEEKLESIDRVRSGKRRKVDLEMSP